MQWAQKKIPIYCRNLRPGTGATAHLPSDSPSHRHSDGMVYVHAPSFGHGSKALVVEFRSRNETPARGNYSSRTLSWPSRFGPLSVLREKQGLLPPPGLAGNDLEGAESIYSMYDTSKSKFDGTRHDHQRLHPLYKYAHDRLAYPALPKTCISIRAGAMQHLQWVVIGHRRACNLPSLDGNDFK